MCRYFIFFLLLSILTLSAQGQPEVLLADKVCNCMQGIADQRPRGYARACLQRVARENFEVAEKLLGRTLGANHRQDMAELLGHLTGPLATNCAFLLTLQPEPGITKYRWTDGAVPARRYAQANFAKAPVQDNWKDAWGEAPELLSLTARVLRVDRQSLQLQSAEGQITEFEIPARHRKRFDYRVGEEVRVYFRKDWRLRENRVVRVLVP